MRPQPGSRSAATVLCDAAGLPADLAVIDALARLQLAVRRHDLVLRLQRVSPELAGLIRFAGLEEVLRE